MQGQIIAHWLSHLNLVYTVLVKKPIAMVTVVQIFLATLLTSRLPKSNNQNLADAHQEQSYICGGNLWSRSSDTLLLQASCSHVCVASKFQIVSCSLMKRAASSTI